ncbi:MAG: Holliday junction resolvase-like protein [Acidobacteriota bacterium]|nr:Holliday junction resolvase-like protein [Acidobacteriota bacterium]
MKLALLAAAPDPALLSRDAERAILLGALVALAIVFLLYRWRSNQLASFRARERSIRRDAVARSDSAMRGRIAEHLAPILPEFEFEASDARFLGSPVDFVVFDGLREDVCDRVVFVEVKTGKGQLSSRERRVRDAVREGRVEWREMRVALGDDK